MSNIIVPINHEEGDGGGIKLSNIANAKRSPNSSNE
jgi:hypothetical protein